MADYDLSDPRLHWSNQSGPYLYKDSEMGPLERSSRKAQSGDPLDGSIGDYPAEGGPPPPQVHPADRAGLMGTKASQTGNYRPQTAPVRAPTPEELMRRAEEMLSGIASQKEASKGASVGEYRPTELSPGYGHEAEPEPSDDWLTEYMKGQR